MIQPIGKNPVSAPEASRAQRHAGGHGEAEDRDRIAATSAMSAARCALTRPDAISASSETTENGGKRR